MVTLLQLSHVISQHSELPSFDTVLTSPQGVPVDLSTATDVTFRMQLLGDPSVFHTGSVVVVEPTDGQVSYEFNSTNTQFSGSYLATITATFGGKVQTFPFNDYFLITVQQDLEDDADDETYDLVFATVAQARALGYELTPKELIRAQGHIEVMCNRMIEVIQEAIDNENLSTADRTRLKKATVYQAAWLRANDDVEERTDVTQLRTAGLSGESATLTADGITLAPLARRVLQGLSWIRSRSVRTTTRRSRGGYSLNNTNGSGWQNL